MKKFSIKWLVFSGVVMIVSLGAIERQSLTDEWNTETPVYDVLWSLGEAKPDHYMEGTETQVKKGEEIVKQGFTTDANGRRMKRVSKHYYCTSCHNVEQEDPNLRFSDPETRLPYVKQKGIPFLQGTTFYGIVNRESWYNDDYVKKYGDEKIEEAHENLRNSIQLCAIECSQGRPMKEWEIDAVLAYYWTLQYKMSDLKLSDSDWKKLKTEGQQSQKHETLRTWLKTFYNPIAPATFFDAPKDKTKGYEGFIGRPEVGKDIYELSCLWCHNPERGVSHYILEDDKYSFQHLNKMMTKDSHFSLYQIVAYGTYGMPGRKPYMPHYPLEKMNKQQVEDLRAYIELRAK